MTSYEARRLLDVAEEPAFEQATAMSESRTTSVSEVTWKSSNPTNPQAASTPISRANSDLSLYTPVRRRSIIQTPGVATRARESPAPSMPSFRHSHPPTPSLSRMQSFESARNGVVSMPPRILDPGDAPPRAVTPCETDYQSIGAFKLGSLRITNGAASPASLEPGGNDGDGDLSQSERADYFAESSVPAMSEAGGTASDKSPEPESPGKIKAPRPRTLDLGSIAKLFQGAGSEKDKPDSGSPTKKSFRQATKLSPKYLAEMAFTPFSLAESRPASPQLQISSKHTALEDRLFEDDEQAEYDTAETLDVRLDPNARAIPTDVTEDAQRAVRGVARADSGFVSTASPSSESSHRPLTKADSGYGSNVSLRSFNNSKQPTPDKEFSQSLDEKLLLTKSSESNEHQPRSPVASTLAGHPSQPERTAPAPPVPPKDYIPGSPSRGNGSGIGKTPSSSVRSRKARLTTKSISRKSRHTPSPILSLRSSESAPKSPDSTPKTPLSAKSDTSTSALSIGSGSHKPNKLQRLLSGARRSSNGPPMVHVTHVVDKAAIPSIPRDAETKLREHDGLFPMTTKRLALKAQLSRDTLKTIFSVGSFEQSLDAVSGIPSVPTVSESPLREMAEAADPPRKHVFPDTPSPVTRAAAHLFPGKAIARKPVPTRHSSLNLKEREAPKDAEAVAILPVEAELASYNPANVFRNNAYDAAFNAKSDKEQAYFSPTGPSRTMSLTSSSDPRPDIRRMPHKSKSSASLTDPEMFSLPSPLVPRQMGPPARANNAPPVSMLRKPMSLRAPQPLRHHPAAGGRSQPTLSRKTSRENVQSYPSSNGPSLATSASRERIRSYPPGGPSSNGEESISPPPIPPQNPRRALSLHKSRPFSASPQVPPNWEVQIDHGLSGRSKRDSFDSGGRANSLFVSNQDHNGDRIQRPSTARAHQAHRDQPPLRHRSSYDGSSRSQRRGHAPAMSNGYTAPSKSSYDALNSLQHAPSSQLQWDQYGHYPSIPRNHYRNRSMGSGFVQPGAPPYRVLHSYNSPAYRNAPIWG